MPSFFFFGGHFHFYFKKNDCAVSPVIGTILMVAITVIVAAVVAVFGFSFAGDFAGIHPKGPTSSVTAENFIETIGVVDMKIQHKGGDRMEGGAWRLSIVPVGEAPIFQTSSIDSDFSVGEQIVTYNLTSGTGVYTVTNSTVYTTGTAGTLISGNKYDVKIIVYPYKTLVLDAVVEVR